MLLIQDLYWVAGLFEGEGYFAHRRNGDLVAQITMVDGDVIGRVQLALKFGVQKQRVLPSGKVAYTWTVTNQRQAAGLMMSVLPIMGERRAAKIRECLAAWKAKPLPYAMQMHCKHGHPFSGDNLLMLEEGKYTKRRCRQCTRDRTAKYRAKLEAA